MNAYFAANNLSNEEKENILSQHRTIYDGYRTLQPNVNNTQPLYVQDFAKDKVGAVVNNKGVAKPYTNFGINEQYFNNIGEKTPLPKAASKAYSKAFNMEEVCDECGVRDMFEEDEQMCSECGGMMAEGECSECGWKGEVGSMEENESMVCECGGEMYEGECSECGYKMEETNEGYKTGKLSDIYNTEDLGDSDFDYVEGGGNDYGTFEKMHHMKSIKNEQIEDNYEDPDNEDDGFEDLQSDGGEMYEQGYTGGGNAPDTDISNIESAYDFESDGPEMGSGPYEDQANDMDLDKGEEWDAFNFKSNGPDSVFPTEGEMEESAELYTDEFDEVKEYETMESAWSEEVEEVNDISGVQGIYGDMEPAYDFDSKGPGSAGPYQTSSWNESDTEEYLPKHIQNKFKRQRDAEEGGEDFDDTELDMSDYEDYGDMKDKSWEEITSITGDDEFSHVDEDIKESFIIQKNKINEMMLRMKIIK